MVDGKFHGSENIYISNAKELNIKSRWIIVSLLCKVAM